MFRRHYKFIGMTAISYNISYGFTGFKHMYCINLCYNILFSARHTICTSQYTALATYGPCPLSRFSWRTSNGRLTYPQAVPTDGWLDDNARQNRWINRLSGHGPLNTRIKIHLITLIFVGGGGRYVWDIRSHHRVIVPGLHRLSDI